MLSDFRNRKHIHNIAKLKSIANIMKPYYDIAPESCYTHGSIRLVVLKCLETNHNHCKHILVIYCLVMLILEAKFNSGMLLHTVQLEATLQSKCSKISLFA